MSVVVKKEVEEAEQTEMWTPAALKEEISEDVVAGFKVEAEEVMLPVSSCSDNEHDPLAIEGAVKEEKDDIKLEATNVEGKDRRRQHAFFSQGCSRKANPSSDLTRQIWPHAGNKPFHCKVCTERFCSSFELRTHMNRHREGNDFVCRVCGNKLSSLNSLVAHMRTHTGEKPYLCEVCPRKFYDLHVLKRHMKTHSGPASCPVCYRSFSSVAKLSVHTRKVHVDIKL